MRRGVMQIQAHRTKGIDRQHRSCELSSHTLVSRWTTGVSMGAGGVGGGTKTVDYEHGAQEDSSQAASGADE